MDEILSFNDKVYQVYMNDATVATNSCSPDNQSYTRKVCKEDDSGAQLTVTRVEIIGEPFEFDERNVVQLVRLTPLTGRKHQLRVLCSQVLGFPIVGDWMYRHESNMIHRKRMYLHAYKLELTLSPSMTKMTFIANDELLTLSSKAAAANSNTNSSTPITFRIE